MTNTDIAIDLVHLRLLPYSSDHLLALIEGYEHFENSFGLPAADGLRDFVTSAEISPAWLAGVRASPAADPWVHGFAIVHRQSSSVIGSAGFKGPPVKEGMVEIGYGIVPAYQGRGHATEAAAALVAFAFDSGRVRLVRAHTAPTPNASTRVLAKCGFNQIGEVEDPDDGLVWRWEKAEV
jgi:[ribosomal protein S5]-alanine N-acetyltransferase